MTRAAGLAARLGLSLLAVCATLAVLELSFRLYHRWAYDVPLAPGPAGLAAHAERGRVSRLSSIVLDDALGWRSTPSYTFRGARRNGDGTAYEVSVTFDGRGFRSSGRLDTGRPRILAIGDSFTQAVEVSDGEAYHAIVGAALGAEVFAYGAGGYGTLQQAMILDAYVDEVRPDLLLWQFCSNDFYNNTPRMERESVFSNNGLTRPYWVDGRVEYVLPKPDPLGLRTLSTRHSRLGAWFIGRWDLAEHRRSGRGAEHEVEQQGLGHAGLSESVAVTEGVMAGVRQRVDAIPIVAFSCDDRWPYHDALIGISGRQGIGFVEAVAVGIEESERHGISAKVEDGHWNRHGHALAARAILAYLRERGLAVP